MRVAMDGIGSGRRIEYGVDGDAHSASGRDSNAIILGN